MLAWLKNLFVKHNVPQPINTVSVKETAVIEEPIKSVSIDSSVSFETKPEVVIEPPASTSEESQNKATKQIS